MSVEEYEQRLMVGNINGNGDNIRWWSSTWWQMVEKDASCMEVDIFCKDGKGE